MKYCNGSKEQVEDRLSELERIGYLTRWERTHNRVCPITGKVVTLQDVEQGKYSLPRINGDSCFGYEVYPTDEYLLDLIGTMVSIIEREPKYMREAHNIVVSAMADTEEWLADLTTKGIRLVHDDKGRISEFHS